jgi:hypothetical protein
MRELKSRLHLENACDHLVQNLLYFHPSSKNVKSKMYRTIIFNIGSLWV